MPALARRTAHWVLSPLAAGSLLLFEAGWGAGGERVFVGMVLVMSGAILAFARLDTGRAEELWFAEAPAYLPLLAAGIALLLLPSVWVPLGAFFLLVALFLANFFRDPDRPLAEGLVSPADGVVTEVREAEDGGQVVVIFMNVHNVHVNRSPADATVVKRTHHPGSKVPAWHKDSERNERVVWDLDTPHGPVRVVQIAGLLARRIVPYAQEGQRLARGERIGIIRLGSRVDVHLPPGCPPRVQVGERVRAGSTTLAMAEKA